MDTNIWDEVLSRIETKVNRHSFYTGFKLPSFVADQGNIIVVRVPDPVFRDWLTRHYAAIINEALEEQLRPGVTITYTADASEERLAVVQTLEALTPLGAEEPDERAEDPEAPAPTP